MPENIHFIYFADLNIQITAQPDGNILCACDGENVKQANPAQIPLQA